MVSTAAIAWLSGLVFNPAFAADWGYDSETPEHKPPVQTERPQTERPRAETRRLPSGKSTFRKRDVEELRAKPQTLELPQEPGEQATRTKPVGKSNKPGLPASKGKEPVQDAPEVDGSETTGDEPVGTSSIARPEAVQNWIELLGLAAPLSDPEHLAPYPDFSKALTAEQKNRFAEMVTSMFSEQDPDVSSITTFWKALKPKLKGEEQRANYRHLFRALLRLRLNSGVATQTEKTLIEEALGPQRMVVDEGEVPFSEDAVNAYTDMAMFLYERHNPGKDINTDQNRELFSNVIRGRFREAPSDADRAAMNNFPLNWAKS
jgi:hypothetical protein